MRLLPIHLHDIALLRRDPATQPAPEQGPALEVHALDDEAAIQAAHASVGHRIAPQRLQRRLHNGLEFLRFDLSSVPVATTWVAGSRGRYVDELNWLLPIGGGEYWVRDVFVSPASRGQRVFNSVSAALAQRAGGPPRPVWSDVDWPHAQSMRAHASAGFSVVARVRSLDFDGRLRWRSRLPAWPLPVTEIEPASRCIWLRGDRLKRHQELIA